MNFEKDLEPDKVKIELDKYFFIVDVPRNFTGVVYLKHYRRYECYIEGVLCSREKIFDFADDETKEKLIWMLDLWIQNGER